MKRVALGVTLAALGAGAAVAAWAIATGEYFRSPVRLALYIAIPGALALIGAACLVTGARARALFATYTLSIGVALVAFELYLQWRGATAGEVLGAAGEADPDSAARLRNTPERAFPHLCSSMTLARAREGGIASPIVVDGAPVQILTGLSGNRLALKSSPDRADARTDEVGFNNPSGQWKPGEVAVLVVGDSFAFGVGAPLGAGFADRLRGKIGTTVNLGCGGNGPLAELGTLVEYGRILKPKVVVWAYFEGNDLPKDLQRESETAVLPRYLEPTFTQNLHARRAAVDQAVEAHLKALAAAERPRSRPAEPPRLSLSSLVKFEHLRTSLGMVYGYKREDLAAFAKILARAKDEARAWSATLVFAYIPGESRYGSLVARWDADGYRRGVLRLVEDLGIPIVDFDAEFRRRGRDPKALFAGHFTPEGHALAGDILADALRKHFP